MKTYTDLEQSKKLAEILPLESADMIYVHTTDLEGDEHYDIDFRNNQPLFEDDVCAWSLAALLEELNRNCWKVSLKCCGAEWDMTYDDGERYISVSADYAIDACYEMIFKLHEQKLL